MLSSVSHTSPYINTTTHSWCKLLWQNCTYNCIDKFSKMNCKLLQLVWKCIYLSTPVTMPGLNIVNTVDWKLWLMWLHYASSLSSLSVIKGHYVEYWTFCLDDTELPNMLTTTHIVRVILFKCTWISFISFPKYYNTK